MHAAGPFTGFPARTDQRTYVLHVDFLALATTYSDRCRKQRQALTGGSTAVMQKNMAEIRHLPITTL